MKTYLLVAVLPLTMVSLGLAQEPAAAGLKVSDIQEMVKSGLSEDLVIASLRKERHAFNLTGPEMIQLKKAGLTDNLIKVMLDPTAPTTLAAGAPVVNGLPGVTVPRASGATPDAGVSDAAIAANLNNPDAPHDSGIYLYTTKSGGQKEMIALERAATQGTKTGMLKHMVTYGIAKGKSRAILPGPRAGIRTVDPRPEFYFYFEDKSAALGKSHGFGAQTVSNPNQFALVKLDVKKDSRETVVGTVGLASTSTGTDSKSTIAVRTERLRPGVYRVIPTVNLEPGEYCFISSSAAGAAASADIFDFSVSPNN